jgi:hypothetical protein
MNYSKQTISFARDLVSEYSKFDKFSQSYTIRLEDIHDFDLHEFCALLMSEDESWACEATGPDNPAYEKTMLPALLLFMKHSTNRDKQIEFNKTWSAGIASYFSKSMTELLEEECNYKTHSEFNDSDLYERHTSNNYWSNQL